MLTYLRPALSMMALFTLLTGLAYPFAMTGLAQALFPTEANGSLIENDSRLVGAAMIAQPFTAAAYLHPRPSAGDWNAAGTGASNLGPTSAALIAEVAARRAAYEAENGSPAPIDAITTSGSGLDPHISVENARAQTARIAAARAVSPQEITALIAAAVERPLFGLYGEARVNVLLTNIALDAAFPISPAAPTGEMTE